MPRPDHARWGCGSRSARQGKGTIIDVAGMLDFDEPEVKPLASCVVILAVLSQVPARAWVSVWWPRCSRKTWSQTACGD